MQLLADALAAWIYAAQVVREVGAYEGLDVALGVEEKCERGELVEAAGVAGEAGERLGDGRGGVRAALGAAQEVRGEARLEPGLP